MIKEGAGVGGINDLMHWSEGDLYTCFLQSNNCILQQCHFFLIQCLKHSFLSHPARKKQLFLDIFYQM